MVLISRCPSAIGDLSDRFLESNQREVGVQRSTCIITNDSLIASEVANTCNFGRVNAEVKYGVEIGALQMSWHSFRTKV